MRKIMQLICMGLMIIAGIPGCNKDSSKDEINPLPLLAMMSLKGNSSLTVKATYNGTESAGAKIYAYLYNSLGVTSRDPDALYVGSADCTPGVESTIKVENILDGDYYVMVLYDYSHASGQANVDNQQDRYILYNNTGFPESASKFTVKGASILDSIVFGNTYILQPQSAFQSPSGYYNLTFKAVYSGDAGTGDKKIHAYLYSTIPGTTPSSIAPYKTFVSSAAVNPGDETGVVFRNVASPGSYYVLVFYDYSTTGTGTEGVQDDRYVFYSGKQYADEATAVPISGNQDLGTISFGNSYTLGSGGTFMSDYGAVTLGVNYTGAETTGYIHVNLYSSLGADTSTPTPAKTWVSASTVSSASGTILVEIPEVHFGNYYMVVYYGTETDIGSLNDPYILYDSKQYIGDATTFNVAGDKDLGTVTLGDSYALDASGAYDTPPVTYSLTVPVRYTGTAGTTGDQKIHVSLYNSLGTTTASPLYTGVTSGVVSPSVDDTVTITGIAPGTYKVLVFYDFNSTASTTGAEGDRYLFFGNSGATSGATDLIISSDTTLLEADRVIFGDNYRLQASSAYMTGGVLLVKAKYTGTESGVTSNIFVYLYNTTGWPGTTTRTPAKKYYGQTTGGASKDTEYTITVNLDATTKTATNITTGNYYVLVFYDYDPSGTYSDNATDRYVLYPDTWSTTGTCAATTISIPFGYSELSGVVSFGDSWIIQSSSKWLTTVCP